MEYEFTFVDSSLVICRSIGVASVRGFIGSADALTSDPRWRPGMDTISDHTLLDASQFKASDIEQIANRESEYSDEIGQGRAAIVVGPDSPTRYGLVRMFEAYIEPLAEMKIRAFWTFDEALAWMRGPDFSLPTELGGKRDQRTPAAKTEST